MKKIRTTAVLVIMEQSVQEMAGGFFPILQVQAFAVLQWVYALQGQITTTI